jgi:hypothetical protein
MITAHLIGSTFITVMMNGEPFTINSDHPNYEKVKDAIRAKDYTQVEALINTAKAVINYTRGLISIVNDTVYYQGREIKNVLVEKILEMLRDGFDADPMLKFLENLMQNPSHRAVKELYLFLESGKLPITDDGCFLAYKKVRSDYLDFYSGTVDNSIGCVPTIVRNEVDDDRDRTCSTGLHFCSLDYLPHYHGNEGRVMIVKINPADVVSIPSDYSNTKGRTCRYEVIGEYTGPMLEHAFSSPVYSNMTPVMPITEYQGLDEEDDDTEDLWNNLNNDDFDSEQDKY